MRILEMLASHFRGEDGQALAEYALILAFIAIVCVAAVTALGLAVSGALGGVVPSL